MKSLMKFWDKLDEILQEIDEILRPKKSWWNFRKKLVNVCVEIWVKFWGKCDEIYKKVRWNLEKHLVKFWKKNWWSFRKNLVKSWEQFTEILRKIWWNRMLSWCNILSCCHSKVNCDISWTTILSTDENYKKNM